MSANDDMDGRIYRAVERALASVPPAGRSSGLQVGVLLTIEQGEELLKILSTFNPLLDPRCDCPRARIEQALEDEGCGNANCPYRFGL